MTFKLKEFILGEFESTGLKGCSCLSDKFGSTIEKSVFNHLSSFIFLQMMNKVPTMKDFCFYMRCIALQFVSLKDLIQKPEKEGSIKYLSKYLDGVVQKIRSIDEGGSLYMVIQCIEQSLILISDLFLIVFGSKSPAGSEVVAANVGHSPDLPVLPDQSQAEKSTVHLPFHRPNDDQRRPQREGRLQLHSDRDGDQVGDL
jgi:hypothetical protein